MRFDRGQESPDIIDKRGEGAPLGAGAGTGILWFLGSRFGWKGVLFGLVALAIYGGVRMLGSHEAQGVGRPARTNDEAVQLVSFVLDDSQALWRRKLGERGVPYRNAKLVLFTDQTPTSCGVGGAASGPFYCPTDERVYIDLGFFRELEQRFGAPGDFAQAYVIAHEIGHHVQKLLGTTEHESRSKGASGGSVRTELQADCYAGIWAAAAAQEGHLEAGDIEEGLRAASAVGDDRLQRESTGAVHPEKWTHGSSEARSRWFKRGYDTGRIDQCDTFSAATL